MTGPAGDAPWQQAVVDLLEKARLAQPDELPAVANAAVAPLGLHITVYAVDQEQRTLRPVPGPAGPSQPRVHRIEDSTAGRCFMDVDAVPVAGTPERPAYLWMPLLDGTERLGVLQVSTTTGGADVGAPRLRAVIEAIAGLLGHLWAVKSPYGDALMVARRTQPMSEASELLWQMLPPLTFVCHRMVVSAILEPCYRVGGDGFDYAVDGAQAFLAVLDTAGHDLGAGLGTAVVLSALRTARRAGADLAEMARAADRALATHLPRQRFCTALLAQLDLDTGRLRYLNSGHPPALVLRRGRVVRRLDRGRRMPLGLEDPQVEIAEEALERGDRLLMFTDGVIEARDRDGRPFGEERLVEFAERHSVAGLPAPETLRRLCHAALDHYDGPPADDATLLLVEWSEGAVRRMMP